jgi:uncharacterized protein YndB with AHSA1/START domain
MAHISPLDRAAAAAFIGAAPALVPVSAQDAAHGIMAQGLGGRPNVKIRWNFRNRPMIRKAPAIVTSALLLAAPVRADVVAAEAAGFQVKNTLTIAAPPAKVYAALVKPAQWWDAEHTWSGKAANLSLSAKAGGCFCEKLEHGGSVQHMTVIYAAPGQELRLSGALGPLQTEAATAVLTVSLNAKDEGTELVQVYTVGGYTKGGWSAWAPDVDAVLSEQFGRLKAYVETGKSPQ